MRGSTEEGSSRSAGARRPWVSPLRAVLEPTAHALSALQRVLRCEQPMRPESPKGALDLGDAGLATTVSRQHLRGQP